MNAAAFTEEFAGRALQRIFRWLIILAGVGTVALWIGRGWKSGTSFLFGATVAAVNFQWLRLSVQKMVAEFLQEPKRKKAIWYKLLGRYVLLAAVVYVIFKGHFLDIPAFVAGLLLPVAASMCEAAYEAYVALRHPE